MKGQKMIQRPEGDEISRRERPVVLEYGAGAPSVSGVGLLGVVLGAASLAAIGAIWVIGLTIDPDPRAKPFWPAVVVAAGLAAAAVGCGFAGQREAAGREGSGEAMPRWGRWLGCVGLASIPATIWLHPSFEWHRGRRYGPHPISVVQTDISAIETALEIFEKDHGRYPTAEEGLIVLIQRPSDDPNWHGPYLNRRYVPKDIWGNDYIYVCPGMHNPGGFDLFSLGPDSKPGTADDVGNW